jgi:hypothetical protein
MLYGTPTRAAHRATAGGGLALFVRGLSGTGQHRSPLQRREPQRTAQLVAQGLAAAIVLGLVTLIGSFLIADAQRALGTAAPAAAAADDAPLTMRDVFPDRRVAGAYRITTTHLDSDCGTAATGALDGLLADHGCTQVVRAAMTAPYGDYEVTAGVFDLADAAGAAEVDARLRHLVETADGNFAPLPAGGPDTLQVGWRTHGHHLLYCVITRSDGRLVTGGDPYAGRITADLVDGYLADALGRRSGA